jgi:hypothetical protein
MEFSNSLFEAQLLLEDWHHYRPHQSLTYQTPAEYHPPLEDRQPTRTSHKKWTEKRGPASYSWQLCAKCRVDQA